MSQPVLVLNNPGYFAGLHIGSDFVDCQDILAATLLGELINQDRDDRDKEQNINDIGLVPRIHRLPPMLIARMCWTT
jgi:hypothetical protein